MFGPQRSFRDRRQAALVAGLLNLIALGSLGIYVYLDVTPRLAQFERLDKDGAQAVGAIIGRHVSGSKKRQYLLSYEFAVAGMTYRSESPVALHDYNGIPQGAQVTVVYLPPEPGISRLQVSTGPKQDASKLHIAYGFMVAAVAMPVLIWLGVIRPRRRTPW